MQRTNYENFCLILSSFNSKSFNAFIDFHAPKYLTSINPYNMVRTIRFPISFGNLVVELLEKLRQLNKKLI